jgi:hypothetical protein
MVHLLGRVLQPNGADKQIISILCRNSDKVLGWQDTFVRVVGLDITENYGTNAIAESLKQYI